MIEKINDVAGVSSVGSTKPRSRASYGSGEFSVAEDGLAVSPFAREMANISFELSKVPEVREDRIKDLKSQIDEGRYNPDLNALAGRLLWAGINKIEN
ncbi:MAG: flagellar biosynthesis anti-sigma factor FlgM [Synergistaceae bacterium]|jgi:negative regulator of flagellin synthesis FlgM|nr:flagellar biosynthesis anti-sigma factor FlgM [Synergistaceae bacterium]